MASTADSGVTVRQVMTRRTSALRSPSSRPTLSQSAARAIGARRSSSSTIAPTVRMRTPHSALFLLLLPEQLDPQRQRLARLNRQLARLFHLTAGMLDYQAILPWRQGWQAELSLGVRDGKVGMLE